MISGRARWLDQRYRASSQELVLEIRGRVPALGGCVAPPLREVKHQNGLTMTSSTMTIVATPGTSFNKRSVRPEARRSPMASWRA